MNALCRVIADRLFYFLIGIEIKVRILFLCMSEVLFLVDVVLKDGEVHEVCITSEKGGNCSVRNPWGKQKVKLIQNGKEKTISDLKTLPGDRLILKPFI